MWSRGIRVSPPRLTRSTTTVHIALRIGSQTGDNAVDWMTSPGRAAQTDRSRREALRWYVDQTEWNDSSRTWRSSSVPWNSNCTTTSGNSEMSDGLFATSRLFNSDEMHVHRSPAARDADHPRCPSCQSLQTFRSLLQDPQTAKPSNAQSTAYPPDQGL